MWCMGPHALWDALMDRDSASLTACAHTVEYTGASGRQCWRPARVICLTCLYEMLGLLLDDQALDAVKMRLGQP